MKKRIFREVFSGTEKGSTLSGKAVFTESCDGLTLKASLSEKQKSKRIIITFHSHKDCYENDFTQCLSATDSTILRVHMRAHGDSGGEIGTLGINERKDCISWLEFVRRSISETLPVYFYGTGTGATAALMADCRHFPLNFQGIIAENPFSSPADALVNMTGFNRKEADRADRILMKNYGISIFDYDVNEAFRSLSRPVLFLSDKENSHRTELIRNECNAENSLYIFSDEKEKLQELEKFFTLHDNRQNTKELKLHYPEKTMLQLVNEAAEKLPTDAAYNFEGKITTYSHMIKRIEDAARGFTALGIKKNDVITLCMPNIPQTVDCLYALNRIGAVASFIHPLSAVSEIEYYINLSESVAVVVPDLFYENVMSALEGINRSVTVIVARIQDELPAALRTLYTLKKGKDYLKFPDSRGGIIWNDFIERGKAVSTPPVSEYEKDKTAVILYSGGTTGISKGICLTDLNLNALAIQARIAMECEFSRGLKNLSAMPVFHGFGLGIGIHTVLINNACCVLLAQFNTKTYAAAMKKRKPNFIAGVPTIFRMLVECADLADENLSYLQGMFVGGDSMPVELKKQVDAFLKNHSAPIQVREGYGLTECVTASCLTPKSTHKEGSIGLPFPDTLYKIISLADGSEMPRGEDGEICISGPTVMKGYLNNPEETEIALRKHSDGKVWLHTGDLGHMDDEGYVYFTQRIKRMIVTSGYNVYPSQVERVIEKHPAVDYCCVTGTDDEYRIKKIKAFIVTNKNICEDENLKNETINHCKKHIAAYAVPKEIEFRKELPKTLVGKVAYRELEDKQ